jgi:hypothetical protein
MGAPANNHAKPECASDRVRFPFHRPIAEMIKPLYGYDQGTTTND